MGDERLRHLDRRLRKALRKATSEVRLDVARYRSTESLSWAAMSADGDNRDASYPAVDMTLGCALSTFRDDESRRAAIVADARRWLGTDD